MIAAAFNEARYQAEKFSLLDVMADTVGRLTEMSEARKQAKLRLHDLGGGPALSTAPAMPKTPVAQPGRTAAVARGDRDRGSGLLTDDPDLAQKVSDWIEKETKLRGAKPSWKEGLLAVTSRRGSVVSASESTTHSAEAPISSAPQPRPASLTKAIATGATQSTAGPLTSGYRWSQAGGWTLEQADPWTNAREAALATAARIPPAAPDQRRTDLQSPSAKLSEQAHAFMAERRQSLDPRSADYLVNYRAALVEFSR